jgi:hypothetical protein
MQVAVKSIAWVYLAVGLLSGFWLAYATLFGVRSPDVGSTVLAVLLGYGLLKFHYLACGFAVLMSVFGAIICVVGLVLCVSHVAGWRIAGGGLIVDHPVSTFVLLGVVLAFLASQLWILTRPEVESLFQKSQNR